MLDPVKPYIFPESEIPLSILSSKNLASFLEITVVPKAEEAPGAAVSIFAMVSPLPTTKITINDKEKYNEELKNNRRIEFRVPSSNSDIKFVLYCVLNSIIYGIENNLQPITDTYNNTFIHNENLEEITNKQYFNFEKYYDYLKVINNYSL